MKKTIFLLVMALCLVVTGGVFAQRTDLNMIIRI